jgi:hypothetical protein
MKDSNIRAALGFRVHSGWTALVVIVVEGDRPRVVWRGRPHLVDTFTFEFRQPYHTAVMLPISEARGVIARARGDATRLARKAIDEAQAQIEPQGYELTHCGLILASGKPLPALERILASHTLIHTADGELFRDALLGACRSRGLETLTVKESELIQRASHELGFELDEVLRRAAALGSALGPPWTQDEKLAAVAAWLALVHRSVTTAPS